MEEAGRMAANGLGIILCLILLTFAGAAPTSVMSLGSLAQTLKDLLASIEDEGVAEAARQQNATAWCEAERSAVDAPLERTRALRDESSMTAHDLSVKKQQLEERGVMLQEQLKDAQKVIESSKKMRAQETEKYNQELTLNSRAIAQIDTAVAKVTARTAFLEMSSAQLNTKQVDPEASYVSGVMQTIKKKLEASRGSIEAVERKQATSTNSFLELKQRQVDDINSQAMDRMAELNEAKVGLVKAMHEVQRAEQQISSLQTMEHEAATLCQDSADAVSHRAAQRKQEEQALSKALTMLSGLQESARAPPSFLQVRAASGGGGRQSVPSLIHSKKTMEQVQVRTLTSTSNAVGKLIAELEARQEEDSKHERQCTEDLAKLQERLEDAKGTLARRAAAVGLDSFEHGAADVSLGDVRTMAHALAVGLQKAKELRDAAAKAHVAQTRGRRLSMQIIQATKAALQNVAATDATSRSLLQDATGARIQYAGRLLDEALASISKQQIGHDDAEREAAAALSRLEKETELQQSLLLQDVSEDLRIKASSMASQGGEQQLKEDAQLEVGTAEAELRSKHLDCDKLLEDMKRVSKDRLLHISRLKDISRLFSDAASKGPANGLVQLPGTFVDSLDLVRR